MTSVEVSSILENGVLRIYSKGYVHQIDEYLETQKTYYEEFEKYGVKKGIIDISQLEFPERIFDQMQIVNFVNDDPYFKNVRLYQIAVVFGKHDSTMAQFWETYSFNRGFNFKGFTSQKDAFKWINL